MRNEIYEQQLMLLPAFVREYNPDKDYTRRQAYYICELVYTFNQQNFNNFSNLVPIADKLYDMLQKSQRRESYYSITGKPGLTFDEDQQFGIIASSLHNEFWSYINKYVKRYQ